MSTDTRTTLERVTSIGGICLIIGAVSDLSAPVGNYKEYALGVGVFVLFVGLVLLHFKGRQNQHTQTALSFGVILSAISGFLLFSNPDSSVSTIAGVSDQIKEMQKILLGQKKTSESIEEKTIEILEKTTDGIDFSWTPDKFYSQLNAKNFKAIEAACRAGQQAKGVNFLETSKGRYDSNMYGDDEVFEFLAANKCYKEENFCSEPFDSYSIEHASLSRVERICGAGIRKRYADQRTAMLNKREAERIEATEAKAREEKEDKRRIDICISKGIDAGWCRMAGPTTFR